MKLFYYQLKVAKHIFERALGKEPTEYMGMGNWLFPPVMSGKVEASDSKEARKIINEMFEKQFPMRIPLSDLEKNVFLLWLKEFDENDRYTADLFVNRECQHCKKEFKIIEKYQWDNAGGGREYCSQHCSNLAREARQQEYYNSMQFYEDHHPPVIYKITNKKTGKCYIGQTTQAFTLRWYQHAYQPTDTQFHKEMKASKAEDWTFEVLETINIRAHELTAEQTKQLINERERFWINHYNSVEDGYNTK